GELIIHNKIGYLIERKDIDGMSCAINKLIESKTLRTTFGINGYNRFLSHFNFDKMYNKTLNTYIDVIDENKKC
ncbi:MAG: glycosyltransferase, partial [Candidatus Phlomobacter fragariae]